MAKFYGIGVGPGDPELLTIKAVKILEKIDVLLVPQTNKSKKGVANEIIEPYVREDLEQIYVDFPMVTDEEVFNQKGKQAAILVEEKINEGKNVAFVTLGDPSVYSTYGYIVRQLSSKVQVQTIPGITSFCAAAAMANKPLVEKKEILSIIPMNASDEDINEALSASDAFAFMKIYKRENRVIEHLTKHNLIKKGFLALRCGFKNCEVVEDVINGLKNNIDYLSLVLARKDRK